MRSALRHALVPLWLTTVACGAAAPSAVAEPRRDAAAPAPAPASDAPLVQAELKDMDDLARAIREHYTKYEYDVRMRDGVRLHTDAFVPKDRSRTYPVLLTRTPYGLAPYGVDNYPDAKDDRAMRRFAPSAALVRDGYVFVHQDVRGRMMSEGAFVDVRPPAQASQGKGGIDEATDAWDTIDFVVKNVPANSGKVGVWGISYPGFYAAQAAVDAHPALKAVSPQAPVTEWFIGDDFHHNGALFLADAFHFFSGFGKPRPQPVKKPGPGFDFETIDGYDLLLDVGPLANLNTRYLKGEIPFWNDIAAHGTRDDFWKARDPRPRYKAARPAVMTVGGWFDAEDLWGALATYRAWETQSPGADVSIVMGPWRHGGWVRTEGDRLGDVSFDAKTSAFYREKIEFPFFQHHLKGRPAPPKTEAWMFETGTNVWQQYRAWPPPGSRAATLSFQAHGRLGVAAPAGAAGAAASAEEFEQWVSDPAKPVPFRSKPSGETGADYMTDDQRFAARRTDVVVYATSGLASDVTLAGPIQASLWVSTTGTDADFIVKVVDVYPADTLDPDPNPTGVHMAGYQQFVRGEVMRGKFRNSFERPEPFKPNEPALVRFTLPDVNHTFRAGHKIMVQVQSSWFPLVDRNPQTFTDIYRAGEADFHAATHRLYRTKDHPSGITVTVARGALP